MRLFISATTQGLGSYREKAARYLTALAEAAGDDPPDVQEYFGADFRAIQNLLQDRISRCDAMLCLVGPAFGAEPIGQPVGEPRRSYTQLEYILARKQGIPVFILFPEDEVELDEIDEEDDLALLQKNYISEIQTDDKLYGFFNERNFEEKLDGIFQRTKIHSLRRVRTEHLPTPLVRLFQGSLREKVAQNLDLYMARIVAFLGLIGGADRADNFITHAYTLQTFLDDSTNLLEHALAGAPNLFVAELRDWFEDSWSGHSTLIRELADIEWRGIRKDKANQATTQWRDEIESLLGECDFLRKYALIHITRYDEDGLTIAVHREGVPTSIAVKCAGEIPDDLALNQVFLLSLAKSQAMRLSPWLAASEGSSDEISLLYTDPENGRHCWISIDRVDEQVPAEESPTFLNPWVGSFLDNESWEKLKDRLLCSGDGDQLVGPGYRIVGEAIHQGCHGWLYTAEDTRGSRRLRVVHLLDEQNVKNEIIRRQFANRVELWRRLGESACKNVVQLDPETNASMALERPFIALPYINGSESLLDHVRYLGGGMETHRVLELSAMALEILLEAERQGYRMISLPLRHFLLFHDGGLGVVGFDTALPCDEKLPPPEELRTLFKDWEEFAPELHSGSVFVEANADVYALGIFIQHLHGRSIHSYENFGSWRQNAFECFIYHCLVSDPYQRFQTLEQARMILQDWVIAGFEAGKRTVSVNGGTMGKYPVTNFEYERYCLDRNKPFPARFVPKRFRGPFAPVVNVSLADAEDYCNWLSSNSDQKWGLPHLEDWMQAVGEPYPWGSEEPTQRHGNFWGKYNGPTVVGSFPAGTAVTGCEDLAGNIWEWCRDRVPGESRRMVKGGSHASPERDVRSNVVGQRFFGGRYDDVGFRVFSTARG